MSTWLPWKPNSVLSRSRSSTRPASGLIRAARWQTGTEPEWPVTLVLDAGGISALAAQRAWLIELGRRGLWPAQVPAVVLAEALTGDHRRDFHADRLLRACQIRDVTEPCAREAARLRTATGQAAAISATDAIVAAYASVTPDPVVLTSDPHGLTALAQHANRPITIAPFSCCHPAHPPRRTLQLTHSHAE
jgi:hypothetical protein